MEAEAEAVDGRLKEAEVEAKEKMTNVASLVDSPSACNPVQQSSDPPDQSAE